MPNMVVLLALACTMMARSLLVAGYVRGGDEWPRGSFVRVTETEDGRRQTVVSSGGFLAVEDAESSHGPGQLYVRQMTNGQDMLLLIFKGRGNLVACERSDGDDVQVAEFHQSYSNGTRRVEEGSGLSKVLQRHPEIDGSLVDWEASKKSCVRIQTVKQNQVLSMRKNLVEDEARTGHKVKVSSRSRRAFDIMWPGTTWCGVGNRSSNNEETEGVQVATDKCCRQHDMCNYTIEGFTSKYNMFNFRFHTISHCECDDRFRTCLRMADNTHSDTVGRLFFNILGMKCFVFEAVEACVERTWWGRCTRQGTQIQATLRESVAYYQE